MKRPRSIRSGGHRSEVVRRVVGLVLACLAGPSLVRAADGYALYQPQVTHVAIHDGQLGDGHYAYNHMASVEWFDGRFHCVWGGNLTTHLEGKPGQLDLWSTSPDFLTWTAPQPLAHTGPGALEADPQGVQWQPNLLNYLDQELWCVWTFNSSNPALDGLYLSRLTKGSDAWQHRRIQRRQTIAGELCSIFASQNPVLLSSGRVLAPVTLNHRDPKHDAGSGHAPESIVRRYNACFTTDDGGETWQCSDPITAVDDYEAQWEPFFYEQIDGRIRAYLRNFTKGIPPGNQWRLTTVGTGAAKGTRVSFPDDPVYSFMETANCRPQVFRLPGGRYCLLQQDAYVNHRDYTSRLNVALHFSRSGADDFVAGPPISRPDVISSYPQGVAHDGRIFLAYTTGPGDQPRSIEGAIVDPAPQSNRHYVWPRAKELVHLETVRDEGGTRRVIRTGSERRISAPSAVEADGRTALRIAGQASAGVELDPVDLAAGQVVELRFEIKPLRLQPKGSMVFCSFGDRIPIRLGMPSNRPGKLYAYTRDQWRPAGELAMDRWQTIRLTVRGADFDVALGDGRAVTFPNPLVNPTPRLYLGDGFEVEYLASNAGSEFLVDLASLRTAVIGP